MGKFQPTHVMTVGERNSKSQYRVKAVGFIKKDGIIYYNVVISPNSKLYRNGIHFVNMVPESNLKEIKKC
jgi:hypothetical protein